MYTITPYMDLFYDTYGFYPDKEYTAYQKEDDQRHIEEESKRIYRVSYPDHFYVPTSRYELAAQNVSNWTSLRYTPYKRISHFREHVNRLQYCQNVTIPKSVLDSVAAFFAGKQSPIQNCSVKNAYMLVKQHLRRNQWSHLNEHIHYLISANTQQFIQIDYTDHRLMCTLFIQMEHQFKQEQKHQRHDRKNIFSYYLIVQLILYLFHYHPPYYLPTLYDTTKRKVYYRYLLTLLQKVPLAETILFQHFKRKRDCQWCNQEVVYFDEDLLLLI